MNRLEERMLWNAQHGQKLRRLAYSGELLLNLSTGKFEVVSNHLPADARVVGGTYRPDNNTVELVIESESFETVGFGEVIPFAEPPMIRKGWPSQ